MKLVQIGLTRVELLPENQMEAQILQLWGWGKTAAVGAGGTAEWRGKRLTIDFDLKAGESERERLREMLKQDPLYINVR